MNPIESTFNVVQRAGVRRLPKHNLKIDMTPLVDLGFLLIAFFIITTEMSSPRVMKLYSTHDGPVMSWPDTKSITFLAAANNKLYYYYGREEDAIANHHVFEISWDEENGIGKIIREKQEELDSREGGRDEMVVAIRPARESNYKNVVDILDGMTIHDVRIYALANPGPGDLDFLSKQ